MKKKKNSASFMQSISKYLKNAKAIDFVIIGGIVVAFIAIIILAIMLLSGKKKPPTDQSFSQSGSESISGSSADSASYDKTATVIDKKTFTGTVLEQTKDAGQEYVDGTLFIGDSNTTRMMYYGMNTLKNNVSAVSMGIQHVTTTPIVYFKDRAAGATVPQAVAIMQPQRIIITYGTNNTVGWSTDTFITEYKKSLAAIIKAYPYADIIINAIPPIDKQRDNPLVTMKTIDSFNAALAKMAKAEGHKFLNSAEVLKDEKTGYAKKDYTISDGFHLSKSGNEELFDYIRTHSYTSEDRRPKPLKKIPARKETPPSIISSDGNIVRGQTKGVQVSFRSSNTEFGTISGNVSQQVKFGGECNTVTAVPKEGYAFSGWGCSEGVISDPSALSLTFRVPEILTDKNVTVTATFVKKAPEVTLAFVNESGAQISAMTLESGTFATLWVSVLPSPEGVELIFASSNSDVADVSADGTVIANTPGQTTISCTAGKTGIAQITVTVTKKPSIITDFALYSGAATLKIGEGFTLSVNSLTPADVKITSQTYSSSNSAVAAVDGNGNVTALSAGNATITCTVNGLSKTCAVTVTAPVSSTPTPPPPPVVSSTPTPPPPPPVVSSTPTPPPPPVSSIPTPPPPPPVVSSIPTPPVVSSTPAPPEGSSVIVG